MNRLHTTRPNIIKGGVKKRRKKRGGGRGGPYIALRCTRLEKSSRNQTQSNALAYALTIIFLIY